MVEFKRNPSTQDSALMEINGRFWGSLPLAVAAGADFPFLLYQLMTDGEVTVPPKARAGVYCRKLSSDLYWHEAVLRRIGPPEIIQFPSRSSMVRDALKVFSPSHYFDVQQWQDPLPGLIDVWRILKAEYMRLHRLSEDVWLRSIHRAKWRRGIVARRLSTARQVMFLCHGNINRSMLAEKYMCSLMPATPLRVVSAGFHNESNRPADPMMVGLAASHGLNIDGWSSRRLTRTMLINSDIVFVMELSHIRRVREEFPEASEKTFLLGMASVDSSRTGEIEDPYGQERRVYERCLEQIFRCVKIIVKEIPLSIE
jgi:protein-tyrosine-phosphatase